MQASLTTLDALQRCDKCVCFAALLTHLSLDPYLKTKTEDQAGPAIRHVHFPLEIGAHLLDPAAADYAASLCACVGPIVCLCVLVC